MLDYVLRMRERDADLDVLFFTEEPPGSPVPEGLEARLTACGVRWHPLRYDVSGRQWMQKFTILLSMFRHTRRFIRGYSRRWLVGYLSYGGSYAVLGRMLCSVRTMVVCFEPHSRYMVELGIWGEHALKTRLMGWLERAQMRRCDVLVVPTTAVRDAVLLEKPAGQVALQAITIDVDRALFDPTAREQLRAEHKLGTDAVVLAYVGKFGGIYHSVEQYLGFMNDVVRSGMNAQFLIISRQQELDRIKAHPLFAGSRERTILQPPVPSDDLHRYLSMADLGVIAIPPTPSQSFRTPVKTAHYWAAGLPIIIPRGVSDDHTIASNEGVGIVVDDLVRTDIGAFRSGVDALLGTDRQQLRERCIATARRYRDSKAMVELLHRSLMR